MNPPLPLAPAFETHVGPSWPPRAAAQALPRPLSTHDFDLRLYAAADYARAGLSTHAAAWQALRASWADLPRDIYLPDGASYRYRRFGRFRLDLRDGTLHDLPDAPFFQAADVNHLNGGFDRHFAPLAPATRGNRALQRLIRFHADALRRVRPELPGWKVYVHQIRIVASADQCGKPAPEGLHQDGHHYVAQVLIDRVNVAGAESQVRDANGALLLGRTLLRPLDSLLVNDRSVFHEVTELHCVDPGAPAWRDMLLIDFNPHEDGDEQN